jgi:hypothetical protein
MAKFGQETKSCWKVRSIQNSSISATRPISNSPNSGLADHLESDNEPLKGWESYPSDWYSEVQEFQFSLVSGILFRPAAVLSQTDFSSVADAQNLINSKQLVE